MYAIFVTINVKPECVEEFTEASFGDAQGSVRDEPDCLRFDINRDPNIPTRFYLYEVYRTPAGLDTHRETPHFKKWFEIAKPMLDGDFERIEMTTVFPSEEGWQAQKPGLLKW